MVKTEEDKYVTYVLLGDDRPETWQLRQNNVLVDWENKGRMRKLKFVAGATSILADSNPGIPATEIEFLKGKLRILKSDGIKIKYVETHPEYGVKYKKLDPEADAQKKLRELELREEAKDKIRGADPDMLRAVAVMIFDNKALSWGDRQVKLNCFEHADLKPKEMIELLDDPKTQVRYMVVLAMIREIITTNIQKTAVLWKDTGEQIIPLAKGERAVEKMADFLYDDKNVTTLQELSKRAQALGVAS